MSNISNNERQSMHGLWSSRLTFILAVTGSAIGLGNIWKFPYVAGANGGGAFVLVYLICILVIGFPIMVSEILIGRKGRRNPITSMRLLGKEETGSQSWKVVGFIGLFAGFLILSYYSVIAGWTLHYFTLSVTGDFTELNTEKVNLLFSELTSSISTQAIFHTFFMVMTIIIIARGIKNGLEKAVKFMMPALLLIMVILLIYSITQGDFAKGVDFLLKPNFSKITAESILAAMGQAFFTLSLGMGCIVMYGAYLPKNESIVKTSLTIIFCDTLIALLAGLVIFPIVFDNNLAPTDGPGLIFLTLPLAFSDITGGVLFGSLNDLSDFIFWKGTIFDNFDYLASNILLPISGLLFTIFASWFMTKSSSRLELSDVSPATYAIWKFLARVVAPIGVIIIFLNAINIV